MKEPKIAYNPWPIGQLPPGLRRAEPELIRSMGYEWEDAREIVGIFERKVAEFAGSRYAVAVDCCTHAIELSFMYNIVAGKLATNHYYYFLPAHSYISVYQTLQPLVLFLRAEDIEWGGIYQIGGSNIIDGAVRWRREMYVPGTLHCLSFQIKKRIPIGRGGMILTDDKEAADWIRLAAYDGRDLTTKYDGPSHVKIKSKFLDHNIFIGPKHYYMTPEDAARGIILMDSVKEEGDSGNWTNYPDIRKMLKL